MSTMAGNGSHPLRRVGTFRVILQVKTQSVVDDGQYSPHVTNLIPGSDNSSAWSVSEYVFGARTSKLTRHLGVKSLSTYSKEYVKQTRH
jgi:hypothetical protein